ncbi:MAG: cyclic nucleotide-binding domain-containing protein [Gammaproteobacteria bacterium]|nr:cyclic nucleotide-binding domain-containing protein [Gammaproteobacteria bacterium]
MADNVYEQYLSSHPFFEGLDEGYIRILADVASEKHFEPLDLIFRQDGPADHFFVIMDGEATIEIPSLYGPPIPIQNLSKGKVLGWSWLIPPYKWDFEARADTKTTVLAIDGKTLRTQCEQDPKLGYELFKRFAVLMSERLHEARMQVMETCAPAEIV